MYRISPEMARLFLEHHSCLADDLRLLIKTHDRKVGLISGIAESLEALPLSLKTGFGNVQNLPCELFAKNRKKTTRVKRRAAVHYSLPRLPSSSLYRRSLI